MPELTALTNCGAVLTNAGPVVRDASVLFLDARTVGVVEGKPPSDFKTIDVKGRVVTPGLVDAHTHAVFVGSRADELEMRAKGATYQEIANAGGGILSSVSKLQSASDDDLFAESKWHIEMMLKCGTTTAEVKSGYGLTTKDETRMLQTALRLMHATPMDVVTTFLGAHAVPAGTSKDQYMDAVLDDMLPLIAGARLAEAVDIFVEEGAFNGDDARRLAAAAKAHGLELRMHVDQFSTGGAQLAAELCASTADHLEQTDAKGIEALAAAGVVPVLLPASVHCLGLKKYPDARRMLDLGMPVVLATDFNPGSSPTPSLPFVMSLACSQMGMTPMEALVACTLSAAGALKRNDTGRIAQGAQADFVVWDTDDLREVPYLVASPLVWAVFKKGDRVL